MQLFHRCTWRKVALVIVLACLQGLPAGCIQSSDEPQAQLAEQRDSFTGSVNVVTEKPTPFTLDGTEPHIGQYTAHGEVTFRPGDTEGSLVGNGVAVFETTDGDHLVGVVTWKVDPPDSDQSNSSIQFSWRDSVTFSDGTVVPTTGHFVDDRPPGLVVIAIIAVLIGMLLPAVQKVR